MDIFWNLVWLGLGFVLLIKGADVFVDGASSTARNFRVSKMLIGLTIVAFGTSAPELAVSISASLSGSGDMVLGNVIGSCILNILLILGVGALVRPMKIQDNTIKKELPMCMLISVLLVVLLLDQLLAGASENQITRADGIVILLFFSVFLYYLITLAKQNRESKKEKDEAPKYKLGKSLLYVAGGLLGIVLGSQMIVEHATEIATAIGVTERVISLTIIAFGTSLPELVTTVVAAKRGEEDLAVGNVIGSNIFNICIVLGVPVVLFGTISSASFQILDMVMLVVSAVMLFVFSATTRKINRVEGAVMLVLFAVYYGALIIQ